MNCSHQLWHDQACEGSEFIPDLRSQTDLRYGKFVNTHAKQFVMSN